MGIMALSNDRKQQYPRDITPLKWIVLRNQK